MVHEVSSCSYSMMVVKEVLKMLMGHQGQDVPYITQINHLKRYKVLVVSKKLRLEYE